jgi:hypothetical protein
VLEDPHLQIAQWLALGDLRGELSAELRLATRPLEEQDHPLRDLQRHPATDVLLHEGQDEIEAGRGASGRVDAAIVNVDGIALDGDSGKPPRELVAIHPVRGGAPALEEPRLGQHEGPGAEPDHPASPGRHPREPADEVEITPSVVGLVDARHDEGVDLAADGAIRALGRQAQARPPAHGGDW